MQIIIHCGAYKTGSSSIQNFFHTKRKLISEEYGGYYPTAGLFYSKDIGYRHTKLFYSYRKDGWDQFTSNMKEQLQEARASGVKFAVISSEALVNPIIQPALEEFIRLLKQWGFEDVKGVVYARNLYAYIVRHYREFTLRHKNQKKINGWINKNKQVFNYPLAFCGLEQIFNGRLDFQIYEEIESTLSDFCGRLGIILPEELSEKRVNTGVNAFDTEINRVANSLGIKHKGIRFSAEIESEFGVSLTGDFSELPSILSGSDWVDELDWTRLQQTFSLSGEQLNILLNKPDSSNYLDIYKATKGINNLVASLVK